MSKTSQIIQIAVVSIISHSVANATLTFSRGEIVFTGYNSDNPDEVAFFTVSEISDGASINFTDNGWLSSGGFRTGEGVITWENNTGQTISAGTEIILTGSSSASVGGLSSTSGSFSLSSSGDQVFAYQVANPTNDSDILGALQMNSGWESNATSSNTSAAPGSDFMALAISPERDSAYYEGPTTFSSVSDLQIQITDLDNWTTSNSRITFDSPRTFTIIPEVSATLPVGLFILVSLVRYRNRMHH
ncbi:MAG: hypothetical protein AAGA58_05815 [Verrucomicrobiota bacterium]